MSDAAEDAKDEGESLFEKAKNKVQDATDKVKGRVEEYHEKQGTDQLR